MTALVRAAGGLLWRSPGEICLVHRPRYDDWSLPKGKLKSGEPVVAGAVREVHEETGLRAALVVPLPSVRYPFRGGWKVVDFWAMRVLSSNGFVPGSEVDSLRWVAPSEALSLLTYPRDISVVESFLAMPPVTGVVLVVRHASAGKRGSWPGPDTARPLDAAGARSALALRDMMALFAPERLVSASPRRCVQTLSPLASALDLPIEVDAAFDEEAPVTAAVERLRSLAGAAASTVVCSQRGLIPPLLAALHAGDYPTPLGAAWLVPFAGPTPLPPVAPSRSR